MGKRGNPEFGKKYKADLKTDEPLSEQVKVLMHSKTKNRLKTLADLKECSVQDLIRSAIDLYLCEDLHER